MLKDLETVDITLSVGLVLTLSQSNWRLSRKKDKLEREAAEYIQKMEEEGTPVDPDDETFLMFIYPVMAACVVSGNCPSAEECLDKLRDDDIELWYSTAKKINPGWFVVLDKIVELAGQQDKEKADEALKKEMMNSGQMPEEKMPSLSSIS